MTRISTTIDGRQIEVERDRWALDVAREMGLTIPTLCHHPALEPYGACRLCVVEVTKGRSTWLTTSCDLPIREGLSIRTDTPAVRRARRVAVELLWASAPDAEPVAELARQMGLERPRFQPHAPRGQCILCGLCVRVCQRILGESAICFSLRGARRNIGTPLNEPSAECVGCRACEVVCPTGHIRSMDVEAVRRMETFGTDLAMARCEECGEPIAPDRQMAHLRQRLPAHVPLANACSRCRRKTSLARLAEGQSLLVNDTYLPVRT